MNDSERTHTLVNLSEERLTLAEPAEDIRGFDVIDRHGDDIGSIEDLLVDDGDRKVRFMQVKSGGFLGLGGKTFHIPIDAITSIHDGHVHIDQTREHVGGAPDYDPDVVAEEADVVRERGYYEGVYRHYGYSPFWAPGYVYPGYPHYGTP